jgi:hypothetical protein
MHDEESGHGEEGNEAVALHYASGIQPRAAFHRNLLEPTGKTLDRWAAFVKKSGRINRQIGITSAAEIDDEVKRLLKRAYDLERD